MEIEKALIIKTKTSEQTDLVKRLREVGRVTGQEIILVPHGVTDIWITIEDIVNNPDYVVILQSSDNGYNCVDLDAVNGFNCLDECWEYARVVMKEAGLPEDSCDSDVWESDAPLKEGVVL
ncbi:hypothetical protein HPT25_28085 [Bacillus sp. BRMEA1]|uniref:hypothetical protein n=1 Tax=Neobacillus endophyticus TaxID=2738405 RepID=UPI001566ED30|nr:hypothetical protein [Neobacillus endophyticus]NRD81155.1 hypothetical protein [Neobacillus endophyticus]